MKRAPSLIDIALFQIGHRGAVERIVRSPWSIPIGLILIATGVVARNYDRGSLVVEPERIAGPFIAPLITSLLVFATAYSTLGIAKRGDGERTNFGWQYLAFLGAFFLTAPHSWLYAVPVERWLEPLAAAKWNAGFLAFVSIWRVSLIVRVFQVVSGAPVWLCLAAVMAPAGLEAFLAVQAYHLLHVDIAAAMGGISLSQSSAQEFMAGVRAFVVETAFWLACVSAIVVVVCWIEPESRRPTFPKPKRQPFPWLTSVVSLILVGTWIVCAIPAQRAEYRLARFKELRYTPKAFDFLEKTGFDAFPANKPIPPDPWGPNPLRAMNSVIENLGSERPEWIYQLYFQHTKILLDRVRQPRYRALDLVELTRKLAKLPGGSQFIRDNRQTWLRIAKMMDGSLDPEFQMGPVFARVGDFGWRQRELAE